MDQFSISQLEQFSGIKAHTIRIWEKRYNALNPNRSEGNTRHYDNSQLRRLLNIVSLMDAGYRVSELAAFSDTELFNLLDGQLRTTPLDGTDAWFVSQLIGAGMSYDEPYFEKIFSNCLLRLGMENTYIRIVYPMLVRIGLMWEVDKIPSAREHFISNMVRQKLCAAIDALPPPQKGRNSWLLFLPKNELHEIGLILAHYVIRKAGDKVLYLGANVAYDTLQVAVKETRPSHLLFFLVHYDVPQNSRQYLANLKKDFSKTSIHLAGNEKLIRELKTGKDIHWIRSVMELQKPLTDQSKN